VVTQNTGVVCDIRWGMLGHDSYDTNSQFITVESIQLQDGGSYAAVKQHLPMPFDVITKVLQENREELIAGSRWERAPVVIGAVENCFPPQAFYDKKKIARRIRDHAKDLKHYSWQVSELMKEDQ